MSWADEMDTLDEELLLQADYPPELEASGPEPVLPSITDSQPSATDARPVSSDGGRGNLARMEALTKRLPSSPHPRMETLTRALHPPWGNGSPEN